MSHKVCAEKASRDPSHSAWDRLQTAIVFEYSIAATDGMARAGVWKLPHGDVTTPCFMPVGTQGTVKGLSPRELGEAGARIVLGNTYHLHLRPGAEVVEKLGGLHRFMAWDRPILTDSGGFQVFSLEGMRRVTEEGVTFRSHLDGSEHFLSPELATRIQLRLGADVAMAFDHVLPGERERNEHAAALERTLRWLERCRSTHLNARDQECVPAASLPRSPAPPIPRPPVPPIPLPLGQTLVPIIQGGTFPDLRRRSLEGILALGEWDAIAIGGLSVGEPKPEMMAALGEIGAVMPEGKPRYLMGVGFPADLVAAIAMGTDLADCVAPTRMGRHGTAFTDDGQLNIGAARWREDERPLDAGCDCETCRTFSRAYLRHLFIAGEMLGLRLVSLHNVRYLIRLGERCREAIVAGTFTGWSREWLARYTQRDQS
jgi:queuine tRNA-ribosyltransferase